MPWKEAGGMGVRGGAENSVTLERLKDVVWCLLLNPHLIH